MHLSRISDIEPPTSRPLDVDDCAIMGIIIKFTRRQLLLGIEMYLVDDVACRPDDSARLLPRAECEAFCGYRR